MRRKPILSLVTLRVKLSSLGVKYCKFLSYIYEYYSAGKWFNFFFNLCFVLSHGGFEMALDIDYLI